MKLTVCVCVVSAVEDAGGEECVSVLGEGGDTGELLPGKSLVFAAMELLVFILVRHLPQLKSEGKESVRQKPQHLCDDSSRLVAASVTALAELPSLCSPAGTHTHSHSCPVCNLFSLFV